MTENVRRALDVVEDVLLEQNADSFHLWNILTALRGPDFDDFTSKEDFTIPIRRAAFPRLKLTKTINNVLAAFSGFDELKPLDVFGHFASHIDKAQRAIKASDGGNHEPEK